jgi:uncharacterized UPF0146 family protein
MTYDKKTGEVTIVDASEMKVDKRIITSVDEVFEQKKKLYEELNLDENGMP